MTPVAPRLSHKPGRAALAWACALACCLPGMAAHAQVRFVAQGDGDFSEPAAATTDVAPVTANAAGTAPANALRLGTSETLQEKIPAAQAARQPLHLSADRIEGLQPPVESPAESPDDAEGMPTTGDIHPDARVRAEGNARLRRADTLIEADSLEYHPASRTATASGQVRVDSAGDRYRGEHLELNIDSYAGHFRNVDYELLENRAHGHARQVDFLDRDRYLVHEGDYTTCQRSDHDPDWRPAWRIRARELHLDRVADVGVARGAALEFMGVPILATPYLTFPLSDRRKSGLLPPTLGLDSTSGLQYSQPYYFNLAPNYDATLTPTLMSKRGVNLGGQFRYLQPSYHGEIAAQWMPSDRLRKQDRWSVATRHAQTVQSPAGDVRLSLNTNRVSDDNYWRDFPRSGYGLSNRLLPSDASARWSGGPRKDLHLMLRARKWQTLQDPDSIIVPPYDTLPQLNLRYAPLDIGAGLDFSLELDSTRFRGDSAFASRLTDGQRSYALTRIARPFLAPQGFFTPAVQLQASHYRLESPLGGNSRHRFVLPTVSLDGGLVFERDTLLLGRSLVQTLEPRAFYTYTPYRDQSMLPMFDTAELDFTFASIFAPNSFVGRDRIADNNLLTMGLSSRLFDAGDGSELVRASIAQRLRFSDQRVTAPGVPTQEKGWSDVLAGGNIHWTPKWATSGVIQYDLDRHRTARYTLTGHYKPGPWRVVSAGYRMKHNASKQIELGWQWPIGAAATDAARLAARVGTEQSLLQLAGDQQGRWYSVGRLNYSLQDKKLVDTIVGLEYSSCCWAGRIVLERLQNSYRTANTRVLFQLELTGLSRINVGSNPLDSLRTNVPYYQEVHAPAAPPGSRFSDYD